MAWLGVVSGKSTSPSVISYLFLNSEHIGCSDSDPSSQARKTCSAAATGGFHPYSVSPQRRPADSRGVAVRFPDRRPGRPGLTASAGFTGQVDLCYAQGASDRDGGNVAPGFLEGAAIPFCCNRGTGSAPTARCDPDGFRRDRIALGFRLAPRRFFWGRIEKQGSHSRCKGSASH